MPNFESSSTVPPSSAAESQEDGTSFGAWTLVWVLYVTKLITIILVVWAAHSYEAAVLVTVTTWIWLGSLIALGAAPVLFRLRLRRVRARRARLIEGEWSQTEPNGGELVSVGATRK